MCKLCENKIDYAWIEEGWLYLMSESLSDAKITVPSDAVVTFPCHYCPWCGKIMREERMMPRITPKEWKHQMQEQEAENEVDR